MATESREELKHLAKLAEQGERYDDMVEYMRKFIERPGELDSDERNLLSVAYKYVVGSRRSAYRILSSIGEREEKRDPDSYKLEIIKDYKFKLEGELDQLCLELLDKILTEDFITRHQEEESVVFFWKMKADYYRYMAEYKVAEGREEVCAGANTCYSKAWDLAEKLGPVDPIKLGLVLNYSVFFFEIMNEPDKACELAKKSFDSAKSELDTFSESTPKDSMLILQLLNDNLSLWTPKDESPPEDDLDA